MAEKKADTWFGSWLSAAKNKGVEVMEFVHKDLEEFSTAAGSIVANTGNAIGKTLKLDEPESAAGTMKRSISSFLGSLNEVLNPTPDDSDTEAIMITEESDTVKLTPLQHAIYNIQKCDDTYLQDPKDNSTLCVQYQCWLEIFNDELGNESISKLLLRSTELREKYTKFVPDVISNETFWKRYLFRRALVEDEMAREEENTKRKLKEKEAIGERVEWGKDDEVILTEEDQTRLLEQYDNELKAKMKKKNKNTPEKTIETKISRNSGGVSSNSSTDDDWEQVPKTSVVISVYN